MQLDELWNALQALPLTLDDTRQPLEIERGELERFYLPLAERIRKIQPAHARALLAVAGPPGCGKSAFAALLTALLNLQAGQPIAALVGLDGWHYPNAYLDSHALRAIKGAPETYDITALRGFLEQAARGDALRYPVYSRARHDPLPAAGSLNATHRLALLEGNYWLLDEAPWRDLAGWFDLRIFLRADSQALLGGLRARHLRGGKSPQATEAHLERVDLPNIQRVLRHALPADISVQKLDGRHIHSVDWGENPL